MNKKETKLYLSKRKIKIIENLSKMREFYTSE